MIIDKKRVAISFTLLISLLFIFGCEDSAYSEAVGEGQESQTESGNIQQDSVQEAVDESVENSEKVLDPVIRQFNVLSGVNNSNETQSDVQNECSDSDNGKNYNVTGTTVATNGNQTDYCSDDYSSWNLIEFFCNENNRLESTSYLCPEGCVNGACNVTTDSQPNTGTCTDTDGGKDYLVKGTGESDVNNANQADYCVDGYSTYNLLEFYCNSNNELVSESYLCENGCSNGACVINTTAPANDTQEEQPVEGECVDDDNGRDYNVKGHTYNEVENKDGNDYCVSSYPSSYNLIEYYCNSDGKFQSESYLCENGCSNGACIGGNEPVYPVVAAPYDCTDTDGTANYGKNYTLAGSATSKGGVGGSDYCVDGNSNFNLIEYFCPDQSQAQRIGYNCPNGCQDGACI